MFPASACTQVLISVLPIAVDCGRARYPAIAARGEHPQNTFFRSGPFNEGGSILDRGILRRVYDRQHSLEKDRA